MTISFRLMLALLASVCFGNPACADALSAGKDAAAKGDFAKAYQKWLRSSQPEAMFRIGTLAQAGNVPGCDLNCAMSWFRKAVDRDYIPAITGMGVLYLNDGQRERALAALAYAARWNEPDARKILLDLSQPVPDPDLLEAFQARRTAQAEVQAEAQARAQQNLAALLAVGVGIYAAKGQALYDASRSSAASDEPIRHRPKHLLRSEFNQGGNHFCRYDDGSVINSGGRLCAVTIEG